MIAKTEADATSTIETMAIDHLAGKAEVDMWIAIEKTIIAIEVEVDPRTLERRQIILSSSKGYHYR